MLTIHNLSIKFNDSVGGEAVRGVNLHMEAGEILGLVGESGSGKTMTALAIAGLVERAKTETAGQILFEGRDLLTMKRSELRRIQGREIGFVFQEPMSSLNPLMRIGRQIEEPLRLHTDMPADKRREAALRMMELTELPEPELSYKKYPHQMSGGQRQRAMIASAVILGPKLLIADEPTTALDVTVQGQILKLLRDINQRQKAAILFISHDLSVVRRLCSRIAVMKEGLIVEEGEVREIFDAPKNEYTRNLIDSMLSRSKRIRGDLRNGQSGLRDS
ncbi:MAG: ABC transporter ATP-binding protein [Clostridiales bacterium]|nr:ABC transporter ATP-binding protein [Clostridiales bacterium]